MFGRKRANNSVSTGIIIRFLSPRLPRLALFGTKLEPAPLKNTCYAIYFSKTELIFNILRSRKINTYNIVIVKLHIRKMIPPFRKRRILSMMFLRRRNQDPGSRKSRKLFGPLKPFLKFRPAYSVKLVFWYVVKGIKIKITAEFRATRRVRF